MANLRSLSLCALAGALAVSIPSNAQSAAPNVRIAGPIDENQLVTLPGNVHPAANAKNDRGPVSASLPMNGLVLVLSRSPEAQAAFDAYVESEYDSGSPNYHQWLTAQAVGERFGPSQFDVATVTGWLTSHGFTVTQVSTDRLAITFNGTAGQVESAFHTSIHNLSVNGQAHIANMSDPQIPAALAPVVVGVKQLHNFFPRPMHHVGSVVRFNQAAGGWQRVGSVPGLSDLHGLARLSGSSQTSANVSAAGLRPELGIATGSGTSAALQEEVAPFDFATMYNVLPLWKASTPITGANQTIAVVGTSDICLGQSTAPCNSTNDVSQFRSAFGLPAGLAPILDAGVNGQDPGVCSGTTNICNGGDLLENSLDVEWSGAVATGAQIVLVTSAFNSQTTPTNDPIMEDAQFIVDNHGSTSSTASIKDIANASIVSISYGNCELGVGTTNNVAYYNLWQAAAAEGISVFIATGDSGAPACDQGGDSQFGNPYSAQFGLAVSGLASTPFNVAVGGTDFSWCQPAYNAQGNIVGCPSTPAAAAQQGFWNSSNNASAGFESAAGYVPETPWNDTCMNPIWASYIESLEPLVGFGTGPSNPEGACNYVQNEWEPIDQQQGGNFVLAGLVDTIGAGGGASNCVVNDIATDPTNPTCTSNSTTTGTANGSIALTNDGWQKPSWQTGVSGIPNDGVRDLPDVSFFAGDGALDSATLVCVASLQGASCTAGANATSALEVGGTSVATPEMAGVMALINQKAGAPQGLPNKQLYILASQQTNASCSAETVKNTSASCYFNDVDQGSIDMPCDNGATIGGAVFDPQTGTWQITQAQPGDVSPNCAAINSGDMVGTLVTSGTNPGFNAGAGYDQATGLGSLNVANVVNAWASDAGTNKATVTAQLSATTIAANTALVVTATVTGSQVTPTGTVTVTGGGANVTGTLNSSGVATITVPANSLAVGTDTLTVTYNGDGTYASAQTSASVTVTAATGPPGTFSLTASAPTAISPGATATSTVTGANSTTNYSGTVTLKSCTLTTSPTGAVNLPSCTVTGTIIYTAGIPAGNGTATVSTSANTAMLDTRPAGKGWLGAGGGAVLAFLVFLGVPARRRSWRAMLGLVLLLASLGGLSACGGGGVTITTNTATSAGTYTFTVSGQGNDSASTTGSGTFSITVN
jgi:subtilase family serine protease